MIWDKLGVITDEVSSHLDEALDWCVEQNLKHVEIRMVDGVNIMNLTEQQVEKLYHKVTERGLFVSAISSPLFKCLLDQHRPLDTGDQFGVEELDVEAHQQMVHTAIRYAQILQTNFIRVFSFWREENPQRHKDEIVQHLSRAAAVAKQAGVVLLLENEHSCNGGYATEVAELVRAVNSPTLQVLWDPGNEERWSPSYPEGYEQVKEFVKHFHLKHWYVAKGKEPLISQLEALRQDRYDGLYVIETHYTPEGGTKKDGTAMTLQLLRDILGT